MDPKQELTNTEKLKEAVLVNQRLIKQKWLGSSYAFNVDCLGVQEGKNKVKLNSFHRELCDFVDHNPTRQKLLLVPRMHLKTTLVTIGKVVQWIAEDPTVRILIANATYNMATAFLTIIKRHLTNNPLLIEIFGNLALDPEKWSENAITLNQSTHTTGGEKEATVFCYGMGGKMTSQHYDKIILDDLVNEDNVGTMDQIEKTIKFYKYAQPLLAKDGEFIIIGTRYHEADLYGYILNKENGLLQDFDVFERRAIYDELWDESKKQFIKGRLLWPENYNLEFMSQKKRKMLYEFNSQYLNDPIPPSDANFKRNWFKYYEEADIKGLDLNRYTLIDPAISLEEQADYSALVTVGVDQWSNIYILDIVRDRLKPDQLIEEIFRNYERWHPISIGIEEVGFQKTIRYTLKKEMETRKRFLNMVELKPDGRNKEKRIQGLQPQYANGKVLHNRDLVYNIYLEDELLRFPRGKHDDIIDCVAYALDLIHPPVKRISSNRKHKYLYG